MAKPSRRIEAAEAGLGAAGEAEWTRLRRQLDLAEGFWLGFVFGPSPATVATLRRRCEEFLRWRGRTIRTLRPESPHGLRAVLHQLFDVESASSGCVWVEAVRADPPQSGGGRGPWTAAWDDFLLRLNEQRDALRRHLRGGLVLAATPDTKPRVRDAAPDLWSVRALVVDLAAIPQSRDRRWRDSRAAERGGLQTSSPRSSVEAAAMGGLQVTDPEARHRLREAAGFLAQGSTGDAVRVARSAVERLEALSAAEADLATALAWLAQAEESDGDLPAASDHIDRAIALRRSHDDQELLGWLDLAGRTALAIGDHRRAEAAYADALRLARRRVNIVGANQATLNDLSSILQTIGDMQSAEGNLSGARDAYEESLALSRQVLESFGESPEALRDLSISHRSIGDVREQQGDLAAALSAYEAGHAIVERLARADPSNAQWQHDLSISHGWIGGVREAQGDLAGALSA